MKSLPQQLLTVLSAATLAICGGAYAQSIAPAAPASAHAGQQGMPADPALRAAKMQQRMARHLAELHDKLKLTAAQEPAWKAFSAAITPAAMPTPPERKEMDQLNTPQRMEKMLERMKQHQEKMQAHLDALKTLYAVLTPEQQKIFDDSHRHMAQHLRERIMHRMEGHMGQPGMPDHTPMMDKKP